MVARFTELFFQMFNSIQNNSSISRRKVIQGQSLHLILTNFVKYLKELYYTIKPVVMFSGGRERRFGHSDINKSIGQPSRNQAYPKTCILNL